MSRPASTAAHARIPTILSSGFRPFFLLGALHAVLMIAIWVPWFLGLIRIPSLFTPILWHSHELLFGFMLAIIAGFVLTAVANWTSRPPVSGWLLTGLVVFWLAGRIAVAGSRDANELVVAVICLLFPLALTIIVTRVVVAAGNKRNFKVAALIACLTVAEAAFHYEAWLTGRAKLATVIAVAVVLVLLTVIAGRIIPNFTSNWLKANRPGALPRPPGTFDLGSTAITVAALGCWVATKLLAETSVISGSIGVVMLVAGFANLIRQARWQPLRTMAEPLVMILHIAYLFIPIGFALVGVSLLMREVSLEIAGLHAWATGAIATMMLAMMTRVTRGHTGNALTAPWGTVALYACIIVAALTRIAANLLPDMTLVLIPVSGASWIAAFLGFLFLYGRMLVMPRRPHERGQSADGT